MTVTVFGYLIVFSRHFYDFSFLFLLSFSSDREVISLSTFPNTSKFVKNTLLCIIHAFSTLYLVFGDMVKLSGVFETVCVSSQSKLKLRRKKRNKIVKIYTVHVHVIKIRKPYISFVLTDQSSC